ncbi:MAG: hypothetical protein ACI4JB_06720 [Porcipelethomonas sp.]
MKKINNCVKQFKKDNKFLYPKWGTLKRIARKNGWLLSTYSDAKKLICEHDLESFADNHRAFTYKFSGEIIILYRDDLQGFTRIHAVCHEFGHICLKHHALTADSPRDACEEAEADKFADALINGYRKALAVASAVIMSISFLMSFCFSDFARETTDNSKTYTPTETETEVPSLNNNDIIYYVTPSGDKYHRGDCYHINPDSCIPITLKEAEKLGYEPCKTCRPDELNKNK